ncbi:coiled-coil domain-containing protein 112-like [Chrysoperla carnea]|uniref:coiled-coil domain-containing protein 112-like n=1 Tax=Chrysoperla carnea TaxID=189513 RepID=UPI001D0872BA|nr:coiled-coil domain-containing protein 112-like [Chrysoperla carnea]
MIKNLKTLVMARKRLKKDITDKNKLKEFDLSYFKNSIAFIEKNISVLRSQINSELERLKFDENDINTDLNKILSKNDLFETTDDVKKDSIAKKHLSKSTKSSSKEISKFLDFVHEKGGHEGGWGVDDHGIFLKYYRQHEKDIVTLIKVLSNFLPEKTDESIIEHVEWFMEYENKKEKYKNAIRNWRQSKTVKRTIEINFTDNTTIMKPEPVKQEKISPKNDDKILKAKIKEWKESKTKKLEEEKQIVSPPQSVYGKSKIVTENDRMKIKVKIANWKQTKLIEKQKQEEEQRYVQDIEKEIRTIESKKLIKEFQDQDMNFIRRRQQLKTLTKKIQPLRTRSLTVPNVMRDPDRIHRATKQWLAKTQQERSQSEIVTRNNIQVLSVNHIPKLRKPEWIGVLPSIMYH